MITIMVYKTIFFLHLLDLVALLASVWVYQNHAAVQLGDAH